MDYLRNYEFLQGRTYQRSKPVVYPHGTAREPPCSLFQELPSPMKDVSSQLALPTRLVFRKLR